MAIRRLTAYAPAAFSAGCYGACAILNSTRVTLIDENKKYNYLTICSQDRFGGAELCEDDHWVFYPPQLEDITMVNYKTAITLCGQSNDQKRRIAGQRWAACVRSLFARIKSSLKSSLDEGPTDSTYRAWLKTSGRYAMIVDQSTATEMDKKTNTALPICEAKLD